MKNGVTHWISKETADKISDHLANQQNHSFIKVKEIEQTLNTAEIDGVYDRKKYNDISNINQGMWQCEYGGWHNKGKKECTCKADIARQKREEERKKLYERIPEEQREKNIEALKRMGEEGALGGSIMFMGIYRKDGGKQIRRKVYDEWVKEKGEVDPSILDKLSIEGVEQARKEEIHDIFD